MERRPLTEGAKIADSCTKAWPNLTSLKKPLLYYQSRLFQTVTCKPHQTLVHLNRANYLTVRSGRRAKRSGYFLLRHIRQDTAANAARGDIRARANKNPGPQVAALKEPTTLCKFKFLKYSAPFGGRLCPPQSTWGHADFRFFRRLRPAWRR